MKFKNFPMVERVIYGRGCYEDLAEILDTKRKEGQPFVFIVDHAFKEDERFLGRVPLEGRDKLIIADVTHEPKTSYVDQIRDDLNSEFEQGVSGVVGIGGGSVLDLAKAVSLMLTNPGSAADYQGWDLVKYPGKYHVGIPTLSGTGAEVSRTAVLTGPTKKLGLNSDYTPFDQIVLDPELIKGAPSNQRFYTGMDCYIHSVESLTGTYLNAFSRSYGEKALEMCQEVFLHKDQWDDDSDEKLMMASFHGGMSIAYSQVGVAHALSYGISFLLGTKHGIGNCIVFDYLEEFYPEYVLEFKRMVDKHEVHIPRGICAGLSDEDFDTMINVSIGMAPLWENALGKNWREIATPRKLRELYERM